jgi:hypothetical protein
LTSDQDKQLAILTAEKIKNITGIEYYKTDYSYGMLEIDYKIKRNENLDVQKIIYKLEGQASVFPNVLSYLTGESGRGGNWRDMYNLVINDRRNELVTK